MSYALSSYSCYVCKISLFLLIPPQDVLSETDNDKRFQDLCSFFHTFGSPGDKGRECGLMYTIIHLWPMIHIYQKDFVNSIKPYTAALIEYFIEAGLIECFLRLLAYCLQRQFLMVEFNRYASYRILEFLFGCTDADHPQRLAIIHRLLNNKQRAADIFITYLNGGVSSLEAMCTANLLANMSSETMVMSWLFDHPDICAAVGRFLWDSHTEQHSSFRQHLDLQSIHQRTLYSHYVVNGEESVVASDVTQLPRTAVRSALNLLSNLCSESSKKYPTALVEPAMLAIIDRGLYDNIGDVICGILLDYDDTTRRVPPDKLMSFVSWSVHHLPGQDRALEQLHRLPYTRRDQPPFFSPWSYAKSRSVIAFLITHSLWFDDLNAGNRATQGVISLLMGSDKVATQIVQFAGDLLFDLAHSIHHVRIPQIDHFYPIKLAIFEVFLKLGGYSYYNLDKIKVPAGGR